MKPLFLYIVKEADETPLAGLTPLEWLIRGAENAPYAVIDREEEATIPDGYRYVAVIRTSTPLVTASALLTLMEEAEKKGVCNLALGRGRLTERRAFLRGEAPKGRIRSPLTEEIATSAARGRAERELYRRIAELSVQNGVIIPDVDHVRIDGKSRLAAGACVEPFTFIKGSVLKEGCRIGAFSTVENAEICEGAEVRASFVEGSVIGAGTTVGPYAYIRMGSVIGEHCRIGDFVEIKKSRLDAGVKAAHLAYIGDATVGEKTNVGCGTVFANYDGKEKHATTVGRGVFIGANVNLVAPLTVGDGAYIAAATTVTKEVPPNRFVIGRTRAENKEKK